MNLQMNQIWTKATQNMNKTYHNRQKQKNQMVKKLPKSKIGSFFGQKVPLLLIVNHKLFREKRS